MSVTTIIGFAPLNKWVIGLHLFNGIGATPAGILLVLDPSGGYIRMPLYLIAESPFNNFLIPGIILFLMNGLTNLFMAWLAYRQNRYAPVVGMILGLGLVVWIVLQVYWLPGVHFLQIFYGFLGVFMVILNYRLAKER